MTPERRAAHDENLRAALISAIAPAEPYQRETLPDWSPDVE